MHVPGGAVHGQPSPEPNHHSHRVPARHQRRHHTLELRGGGWDGWGGRIIEGVRTCCWKIKSELLADQRDVVRWSEDMLVDQLGAGY